MSYWTLEYNGLEQSLEEWGLRDDVSLERVNQAADVFGATAKKEATDAPAFSYAGAVIVRRDREWNAVTEIWESGTIYFQGKSRQTKFVGTGLQQGHVYEFAGPWWDLERLVFQQPWNYYTGDPEALTTIYTSELFLGQDPAGASLTTGAQVEAAITYAATCGVGVQLGTVDAGVAIPSYNTRDQTVAEVIVQMLRWTPDVVAWFDYSTNPPTFHARKLANLTAVNVTIGTDSIKDLRFVPRNDLVLPAVVIRFKRLNEVNGKAWQDFSTQKYPAEATGQELGAAIHNIELGGFRANVAVASIECATASPSDAAWWQARIPWMAADTIDDLQVTVQSIKDSSGNDVSLVNYPRELVKGQIADWMGFNSVQVTIRASVTYDAYADVVANTPSTWTEAGKKMEISTHVTLTNGTTGVYSVTEAVDPAEVEPSGLAQGIFEAHATLQHEGEITLSGDEVPTGIGLGCKVSVVGGRAEWINMLVQRVHEVPARGEIKVALGPARWLSTGDLIELLRVNRYRIIYNSPSSRISAEPAKGSGSVTLGEDLPKRDSTDGAGIAEAIAVAKLSGSNYLKGELDAQNGVIYLGQRDSSGSEISTAARVRILLSSLGTRAAEFRWLYFKDAKDSCAAKKMLVLGTEPEADT